MANPGYVRSTDGNNADDGSTWALANATVAGAITDAVAGDAIYVSDNHAESNGSGVTWTFPGTLASPNRIVCADDAAEPPTAVSAAPTWTITTGASHLFNGSFYWRGGTITGGNSGASNIAFGQASTQCMQVFENVAFRLAGGATAAIGLGSTANTSQHMLEWRNCTLRGNNSAQRAFIVAGFWRWIGGGVEAGGTAWAGLFTTFGSTGRTPGGFHGSSLDLSGLASSAQIFPSASGGPFLATLRNCKLPASATLAGSGVTTPGYRCEMYNCDSGDTNYRVWIEDYAGSVRDETTIVKSSGASDGTTSLSWKMTSSADAEYPFAILRSPEIRVWSDTTGAKTATIDVAHFAAAALKDDEIWLEVEYLGTSGVPLGGVANDCKADVLATAADQATSTAVWNGTGSPSPIAQKLEVSFTTAEKGIIVLRVCLAKASTTVYVDPLVAIA